MIATNKQTAEHAELQGFVAPEHYETLAEMIAEKVANKLASRPKQRFWSSKQLCEETGLHKRTIQRWKDDGKIPYETAGRRILYPVDEALAAIANLKHLSNR